MEEVTIFNNPEFGDIRTVVIDGEPWFAGKDLSSSLGYKDNTSAMRNVEEEDKRVRPLSTPSGTQKMTVVNESGLYSLIFGSKLESAKKFKKWVTSEVLPSIRKNGGYGAPQTIPEQIQLLALGNVELNKRVDGIQEELESLKLDMPILPIEADRITEAVKKKGVEVLGSRKSAAYRNRSLCQKVYKSIYANLKYNFGVKSYKSIKRSQCDAAIGIIESYKPPFFLAAMIDSENDQQSLDLKGGGME